MPKTRTRTQTWIAVILVAVGIPLLGIPGLWLFMGATATKLHPDPKNVPSVADSAPVPQWAHAAEQGRRIVRATLTEQNLPGLSVAVGIDGGIVWAEGFGYADLTSSTPVTPNHRFRIGTASAVLTSAAAGLLLEDGRLKLDDVIQTNVPAFPKKEWPVTLRQVMGHTAGVISDGGDEGPLFTQHCQRPVDALKYFADSPLLFEPGTQFNFSRNGWILVSAAVEAAAGEPFLSFMQKRVFEPLEMRDTVPDSPATEVDDDFPLFNLVREKVFDPRAKPGTSPNPTPKQDNDRVTSYFPRFMTRPTYGMHLMRPLDYSCYAGASVFLSTPSDLARFGMAINNGKLLRPATVQMLQTTQRLASGEETGYGLGWDIETATLAGKQTRVVGHDGDSLGGMVASLMTFPEQGIVVAVTSNISYADTFSLAAKIAQAFAEQGNTPAGK